MILVSPQSPQVVIRRIIKAPVARVFAAWSDPALLAVFMRVCTFSEAKSDVQIDFRVGGAFRIVMQDKQTRIPHTGVYTVIKPPEQLAFTWVSQFAGEDSEVTIDFTAVPEGTALELKHRRLPPDQVANHTGGWTEIMGALDALFA